MLVELCARNYATHYGFVNVGNGIFQASSKVFNAQEVIWIIFNNPKWSTHKNKEYTFT
jgi:hypothetical protein